jgi:hypothetical protein
MIFPQFLEAVRADLQKVGARIVESSSIPGAGTLWWITLSRAGCLYRIRLDQTADSVNLERGQGSFVPNAPTTWRLLEARPIPDLAFEMALEGVEGVLRQFGFVPAGGDEGTAAPPSPSRGGA